ncbi:hypothetical protein SDC9_90811 [bioreactor metagenome]|uniref:Uncharacterized protein n=1 Tax=bioreactor metagenome TaxID=1076179 RepID=A0A644ZZV1_9ZZZZ|nr:hypothetical protein [Candidatus Metalachnospira sp.]
MLEGFSTLSEYDYFYAAVLAFFITYILMKFKSLTKAFNEKDELEMNVKNIDKTSIIERCTKMFPIETISFNGRVFKKGTVVRITTIQKKVFQGEFIGKNDLDIICILTNKHIIAHEIKKITEMISLDEQENNMQ